MRSKVARPASEEICVTARGEREHQHCLTYLSTITTIESEHVQILHPVNAHSTIISREGEFEL